jgi:glycolate oxidase
MLTEGVKKELTRIVGKKNVSFSKEDAICYSYDATNTSYLPDAVVFPEGPQEISLILKMATSEGFPVIPRGAGSGFSGGSLPTEGGVVLSTERMAKIIEIDTSNLTAVVEPGVVTGEFQKELEGLGLFYPPDPTSLKFSTIGGNIAECAGGPRALKYGVTRDYVMGLEVVLPTGEIVTTGVKTIKGVVGYDLTRLMVGSEGTLGVVTKAFLKLIPLPSAVKTMLAVFPRLEDATSSVLKIINSKVLPCTLELMDSVCIRCVEEYTKMGLPQAEALVLIEVDGDGLSVEKDSQTVKRTCLETGAESVRVAADRKEVKAFWNARRNISPALTRLRPYKLNEDVVVPRSKLPELIRGIHDIGNRRDVVVANFGHAGDGNIHVNVMVDINDPDEKKRGEEAVRDIFELTMKLQGTLSGEHGVGITKAPYLGMELSPEIMDLTRRIKGVFDPKGILNPGKMGLSGPLPRGASAPGASAFGSVGPKPSL